MKFYAASSFKNIQQVRYICEQLKLKGFKHTYDWTQNERAANYQDLQRIGQAEKQAVIESDFLVVLLPAGKGSHIEMGIALGLDKKIFLYSPNEEVKNMAETSTFYHLPQVEPCYGNLDNLLSTIVSSSMSVEE
jgi:hypothetical protein